MNHPLITTLPAAPPRPDEAHKGTFGTVVVVGGSPTMIGAPALTASAALRIGAGLVKIAGDSAWLAHALVIEPSATGLALPSIDDALATGEFLARLDDRAVVALGPGFGVGAVQQHWVARILGGVNPVVLDADGLNNLAAMGGLRDAIHAPLVMTPHPGEYARLATAMGLVCDPLEPGRRPDAAVELARACQAVVVLKGRHSIVTDGRRVYVNSTGNPALATAGSGDVLTGTVAGLIAQGLRPLDAAVLAVHLHGAAADRWAAAHGPAGLAARDLASLLPDALHHHRVAHP